MTEFTSKWLTWEPPQNPKDHPLKPKPQNYLYATTAPLDLGAAWLRFSEFLIRLSHLERRMAESNLENALATARQLSSPWTWDGEFREGPFVEGLPGCRNIELAYVIAWRQDSNGTTFIASPEELSWLSDVCYSRAVLPAVPTLSSEVDDYLANRASEQT